MAASAEVAAEPFRLAVPARDADVEHEGGAQRAGADVVAGVAAARAAGAGAAERGDLGAVAQPLAPRAAQRLAEVRVELLEDGRGRRRPGRRSSRASRAGTSGAARRARALHAPWCSARCARSQPGQRSTSHRSPTQSVAFGASVSRWRRSRCASRYRSERKVLPQMPQRHWWRLSIFFCSSCGSSLSWSGCSAQLGAASDAAAARRKIQRHACEAARLARRAAVAQQAGVGLGPRWRVDVRTRRARARVGRHRRRAALGVVRDERDERPPRSRLASSPVATRWTATASSRSAASPARRPMSHRRWPWRSSPTRSSSALRREDCAAVSVAVLRRRRCRHRFGGLAAQTRRSSAATSCRRRGVGSRMSATARPATRRGRFRRRLQACSNE